MCELAEAQSLYGLFRPAAFCRTIAGMRVTRRSQTELLVEDSSLWIAAVCGIAAVVLIFEGVTRGNRGALASAGFFLLCSLFWIRKSTFVFDSARRTVDWKKLAVLKRTSGSLAFDDITGVSLETSVGSNSGTSYRLALLTRDFSLPLSDAYSSGQQRYDNMRQEIAAFLGGTATAGSSLDKSVRSLLQQERKVDAISLLRTTEGSGLTDAVARVDGIEDRMKAEAAH
jgi:hypothetical protein